MQSSAKILANSFATLTHLDAPHRSSQIASLALALMLAQLAFTIMGKMLGAMVIHFILTWFDLFQTWKAPN